jgi:DNA-binding ferritin-like protein
MDEQDIIQFFMSLLGQIKLYHWSTMSYSKHKALDELHASLSDKVDSFIESYIGKYNKQPLKVFTIKTSANTNTKGNIIEKYLESNRDAILIIYNKMNSAIELQNILQDIMGHLDTAIYLCRLT